MEFLSWPKTPRLLKPMFITEKIDGTNGCVIVEELKEYKLSLSTIVHIDGKRYSVGAQSRNRILPMGPKQMDDITWQKRDNAGFAAWVRENAEALADFLGPGYHYGEWFGSKIARNYGLSDRRFALFNTSRWGFLADPRAAPNIAGLVVVPTLYMGEFDTEVVKDTFAELMLCGSQAVPGFMKPEGVIVYHSASSQYYKMTDQGDKPKFELEAVAA
jgi:hypothetical protein